MTNQIDRFTMKRARENARADEFGLDPKIADSLNRPLSDTEYDSIPDDDIAESMGIRLGEYTTDTECPVCHARIRIRRERCGGEGRGSTVKTTSYCDCKRKDGKDIGYSLESCYQLFTAPLDMDVIESHIFHTMQYENDKDERERAWRDEDSIKEMYSKCEFSSRNYGIRGVGTYDSILYICPSYDDTMVFSDNREYEFRLDIDVVKDIIKVLQKFVEEHE